MDERRLAGETTVVNAALGCLERFDLRLVRNQVVSHGLLLLRQTVGDECARVVKHVRLLGTFMARTASLLEKLSFVLGLKVQVLLGEGARLLHEVRADRCLIGAGVEVDLLGGRPGYVAAAALVQAIRRLLGLH